MGDKHCTMHSAVAAFGERVVDDGGKFGFRGLLLMCCHDWGIWDADARGRVFPPKHLSVQELRKREYQSPVRPRNSLTT